MAINVDYEGIEIGELAANTSATFYPGRPVYLNSSTQLIAAAQHKDCLGLIKEAQSSGVRDEISGQYGIYGSGRGSVLVKGIVTVQQSTINGVSYAVYDESPSTAYAPMQRLYVDSSSLISNAGNYPNGVTWEYIGMLLTPPTNAADGDPMQILVE